MHDIPHLDGGPPGQSDGFGYAVATSIIVVVALGLSLYLGTGLGLLGAGPGGGAALGAVIGHAVMGAGRFSRAAKRKAGLVGSLIGLVVGTGLTVWLLTLVLSTLA